MVIQLLTGFAVAIILALIFTPLAGRVARAVGAIDTPNERKMHLLPMPRLGGLAIVASIFFSLLILEFVPGMGAVLSLVLSLKGLLIVVALGIVFAVGVLDDIHPTAPGPKFAAELVAASFCYAAGLRITTVSIPFGSSPMELGIFSIPVTVIWIVGITNAFNLIDGLDGLAAGVGVIASLTIFSVLMFHGESITALLALILAGALLGFLRYNFNPAKIFLGDSGSLMVGMGLALLSLGGSAKGSAIFALLVPIIALGLPILETLLTMVRRLMRTFLPDGPPMKVMTKLHGMFLPDKSHIHHQLVLRGMSHRHAVLVLYLVSGVFGLAAFGISAFSNAASSSVLVAAGAATLFGVHRLGYREMAILSNGMLLPLYDWAPMRGSVVQSFLDFIFTGVAFYLAIFLTDPSSVRFGGTVWFVSLLPIICGIQISVFYFNGLYKESPGRGGIDEVLRIVRATGIAVLTSSVVVVLFLPANSPLTLIRIVLNFYFLVTLVGGSHLSFLILRYLFRKESKTGRNTLIYGAGDRGLLVLHQILNDDQLGLKPIGFLDDHPHLEGKQFNGYPVFGGHWKLQHLFNRYGIDEIVIAADDLREEVLIRLNAFVKSNRISIHKPNMSLENIPIRKITRSPVNGHKTATVQSPISTHARMAETDQHVTIPR